ncbi:MAG: hypothetical protein QXI58_08030 [Candidatus Micrarchaeia archaeon]
MAITGLEWVFIFSIIILVVVIFLVTKYPTLRIGLGAALIVLGLLLFLIPFVGLFLGGASLVFGIFLLVWGVTTLSSKRQHHHLRICPGCGRDISSFPSDIKRCPYCGKELS